MDEIIFKYPGQVFVGLASKQTDGKLNHFGFTLVNVLPKKGDLLFDRQVVDVLTDDTLLKERSALARNPIEAVAILARLATASTP
jgi:hypothetical protein